MLLILFLSRPVLAQEDKFWVFGDSAMIDFSNQSSSYRSVLRANWGCSSISDTNGNLLLYSQTNYPNTTSLATSIYNGNNSVIATHIAGSNALRSSIILKDLSRDSSYYLFTADQASFKHGVLYNRVYFAQAGIGSLVERNISILSSVYPNDAFTAVRHGNGRDWWVFWHLFDKANMTNKTNKFYRVSLSPFGISPVDSQAIGKVTISGSHADLSFSPDGTKAAYCEINGLLELFDFDRCAGLFSNPIIIKPDFTNDNGDWNVSFSPSGRYLYVNNKVDIYDTAYLFQYDLSSSNILGSRETLYTYIYMEKPADMMLASDNKIYMAVYDSTAYHGYFAANEYTNTNMNLSVINDPDLPFPICNFTRNSFYLNGARTYGCLPNFPNFKLKAAIGSPCDSLSTAVPEHPVTEPELSLLAYPNPASDVLYLTIQGNRYAPIEEIAIYNAVGAVVYREIMLDEKSVATVSCASLASGIYLAQVRSKGQLYSGALSILH